MRTPKMILFDYGQTLIDEQRFDGVKGTAAAAVSSGRGQENLSE